MQLQTKTKTPKLLTREIILSNYFPKDTVYFYGYPSGEASNFYNLVPPWIEELVAARPLVCADQHLNIITYPASLHTRDLLLECGADLISSDNIHVLPHSITNEILGNERNTLLSSALTDLARGRLVMAQPLLHDALLPHYQIPADDLVFLNNKNSRIEYIPQEFITQHYQKFENGAAFAASTEIFPLSCVVKVSSSSAGDGIRVCNNKLEFEAAQKTFADIKGSIFIEEYIQAQKNYCVQFAIPADSAVPAEILGYNEQLTAPTGEFLGGVVKIESVPPVMEKISKIFLESVVPYARSRGWFGVGGADVLVDESGHPYFIDLNFRMTATFPAIMLTANDKIKKSSLSFIGKFFGSEAEFRKQIIPVATRGAKDQLLELIALTKYGNEFRLNAALLFDDEPSLSEYTRRLQSLGIKSRALEELA